MIESPDVRAQVRFTLDGDTETAKRRIDKGSEVRVPFPEPAEFGAKGRGIVEQPLGRDGLDSDPDNTVDRMIEMVPDKTRLSVFRQLAVMLDDVGENDPFRLIISELPAVGEAERHRPPPAVRSMPAMSCTRRTSANLAVSSRSRSPVC